MFHAANEVSSAGTTRRTLLRAAAMGALGVPVLSACSSGSRVGAVRFYQSKPEVIGYFDNLVAEFNKQDPDLTVVHDSSSSLVASFVREAPHDIVLNNYDLSAGTFVTRDVLTDLGGTPEISRINPDVQALVGQYATPEQSTHVIPYSIAAAGVIYNKQLFAQQGVAVPTTWTELLAACKAFQSAGITPIYMTFKDPWTIQQGLFDYVSGSMMDVAGFFSQLKSPGCEHRPTGSRVLHQVLPARRREDAPAASLREQGRGRSQLRRRQRRLRPGQERDVPAGAVGDRRAGQGGSQAAGRAPSPFPPRTTPPTARRGSTSTSRCGSPNRPRTPPARTASSAT